MRFFKVSIKCYFSITGKPIIQLETDTAKEFFMVGRNVELTCNVTSNLEDEIVWLWQACDPFRCSSNAAAWSVVNKTTIENGLITQSE